jgi:hypothetical protein
MESWIKDVLQNELVMSNHFDLLYDFNEISDAVSESVKTHLPLGFFLSSDSIEIIISKVYEVIEHPEFADKREVEIVLEAGRAIKLYDIHAICPYDVLVAITGD